MKPDEAFMSVEEVAKELKISIQMVKWLTRQAIKKIKKNPEALAKLKDYVEDAA